MNVTINTQSKGNFELTVWQVKRGYKGRPKIGYGVAVKFWAYDIDLPPLLDAMQSPNTITQIRRLTV